MPTGVHQERPTSAHLGDNLARTKVTETGPDGSPPYASPNLHMSRHLDRIGVDEGCCRKN